MDRIHPVSEVTFAFLKCFSQYVHPESSSTIVISSFINHGLFVKPSMNAKPMLDCLKFAGTNLFWFYVLLYEIRDKNLDN